MMTTTDPRHLVPISCRICGDAGTAQCVQCPTPATRRRRAALKFSSRWPEVPFACAAATFLGGVFVGRHF
jgi:hypothetical protein